jgi:hypothetical protein
VVEVSVVGVGEKSDDVDERYFGGGEPWLFCVASQHGEYSVYAFVWAGKFKNVFSHLRAKKCSWLFAFAGKKKCGTRAKVRELGLVYNKSVLE